MHESEQLPPSTPQAVEVKLHVAAAAHTQLPPVHVSVGGPELLLQAAAKRSESRATKRREDGMARHLGITPPG